MWGGAVGQLLRLMLKLGLNAEGWCQCAEGSGSSVVAEAGEAL
jgi:hypothetical protein